MIKQVMAIGAIVIITVLSLWAPFSTEARNVNDKRGVQNERHRFVTEVPAYAGDEYTQLDLNAIMTRSDRARRGVATTPSPVSSPATSTVTKTSTQKEEQVGTPAPKEPEAQPAKKVTVPQPKPTVVQTQPTPVVIPKEEEDNTTEGNASDDYMSQLVDAIHTLTNKERARAGVSSLKYDPALATIARKHSEDMAKNDYFSHTTEDGCDLECRFEGSGYDAQAWGENIAWRSSSSFPSATELAAIFVKDWMNSDGHRRNILSDNYTHEGIGVARIGNKIYATANFADPK